VSSCDFLLLGAMFGGMPTAATTSGFQMKAGKLNLDNTTVTADPRKGLLVLRKAEDGLMHLIWKDRNAGTVVDDLIVFEGDATIKQLEDCKDGFAMLLEFSQTARKLFFYSQEPRKKGLGWASSDTVKERELLEKANNILTGGSAAAPTAPRSQPTTLHPSSATSPPRPPHQRPVARLLAASPLMRSPTSSATCRRVRQRVRRSRSTTCSLRTRPHPPSTPRWRSPCMSTFRRGAAFQSLRQRLSRHRRWLRLPPTRPTRAQGQQSQWRQRRSPQARRRRTRWTRAEGRRLVIAFS